MTTPTARPARRGLTLVFTGNGKGKTTAAVGLTVRAAGNRMRVFFLQFIKDSMAGLTPNVQRIGISYVPWQMGT